MSAACETSGSRRFTSTGQKRRPQVVRTSQGHLPAPGTVLNRQRAADADVEDETAGVSQVLREADRGAVSFNRLIISDRLVSRTLETLLFTRLSWKRLIVVEGQRFRRQFSITIRTHELRHLQEFCFIPRPNWCIDSTQSIQMRCSLDDSRHSHTKPLLNSDPIRVR